MNTINITIAEVVATAVEAVEALIPNELLPITIAEILDADFSNDDEAEFLQEVLSLQKDIENVLLSDNPEEFLLPTENDLSPAIMFLEKLEELKSYAFGDRTLARMERNLRGENIVIKRKMTETDKANHPEYRCCPKCERHFTKSYLGHHIDTPICIKVATAHNLRPITNQQKKVSKKIYNACLDLEDLYARAVAYKKHIEPELVEETIEETNEDECVYVIKTWEYDSKNDTIEYAGLWEDSEGNKEFKNEDEARLQYEYATDGQQGYCGVTLIKIDPNNPVRETCINDWEDNISDYGDYCETCECLMTEEDKDLELDLEKAELIDGRSGKNCIKCWKNFMTENNTDGEWEDGLYIVDAYLE